MTSLAEQIAQRRRALGMTQQKLADRVGAHQSHVSHWESGYRHPRASSLLAIADALGCDVRLVPREAP